jgi:hypothetical protein
MQRWTLHDPVAGDTYTMRNNPKGMTTPVTSHRTNVSARSGVDGNFRAFRQPGLPHAFTFSGRIRRQEEYDALLAWAARPNRLIITDHLGREHEVIPVGFAPTPVEKTGTGNPMLFDYTFKTLYMRRVP